MTATATPRRRRTRRAATAPPPPAASTPELQVCAYVDTTRLEVLQCRDLRHAWPRAQPQTGKRPRTMQGIIEWRALSTRGDGTWERAQRTMWCSGRCQTRRVEVFYFRRDRTMIREGRPQLRYPHDYRRKRPDLDTPLADLDVELLRGAIIARLYPNLIW